MHRAILGTVVWLCVLSACAKPLTFTQCQENAQCPSGTCDTETRMCVADGEGQDCPSTCRAYEACAKGSNACVPRYTVKLTPADVTVMDAGTFLVQAELQVQTGFSANYPDHLAFTAAASGGGPGGVFSNASSDGGIYFTQWTPPGEGPFHLEAAYPEEGGPSAAADVTVNFAPSITVAAVIPTPVAPDAGFIYADPMTPAAWRRDQVATVRIESNASDLDPKSVSVVVHGMGGTDLTGLTITSPLTSCMALYCGSVDVPLWKPNMPAFRGNFTVEVSAKDTGGLLATASGSIPVTRWKWSFNGAAGAVSSPAVGQQGTIYLGTNDSSGKVFALSPEGTKKWENPLGQVKGSPAVGVYDSGMGGEKVYVGVNSGGAGILYALGGSDGASLSANQCPTETISTATTVLNTKWYNDASPFETAVVLGDTNSFTSLRVGASAPKNCVSVTPNTSGVISGASIIAKGNDVYFVDNATKVQAYTFSSSSSTGTSWVAKSGYTAPTINTGVVGMGFSSSGRLVGAAGSTAPKLGGVFSFTASDGSSLWKSSSSLAEDPVRNMSIKNGDILFYGHEASGANLTVTNLLATSALTNVPSAGSIVGAPVMGASNIFYTAISAGGSAPGVGELTAWSTDGYAPLWKLSDNVGLVQASPSIDCARGSGGTALAATYGVLYVPSINGKLYAFVVDSPGLDTTSPWPKYQHDARNTGNPDTPFTTCPTP